ncbi:MAG: DUF2065 domain-containing protein [Thiotrichales bacterium]
MSWTDLGAAIALLLVFEGLMPFIAPDRYKRALQQALDAPERTLRAIGLFSMLVGLVLLYWVRG